MIKVAAVLWIRFRYDGENILITVGDTMASILKFQGPTTASMCFADKRYGTAVSKKRWILFFLMMICSLLHFIVFGAWGLKHARDRGISLSLKNLWKLGFGRASQNTIVLYRGGGNADSTAIIANLPQVILALVSFVFMTFMSSLFLAEDWSRFAFLPQSLMNSTFNKDGTPVPKNASDEESDGRYAHLSNCGYSPIAIIFLIIAAVALLIFAISCCFRRFPPGSPPVASTCSAAISAACHPVTISEERIHSKLRSGADASVLNGVGHCYIVSDEIWRARICRSSR
ncbi:hypothetical protein WAI453_002368 [Rhynchosporium graminicola]